MQYHKVPIGEHFIALKVFLGGDAILPAMLGALLFFIVKANCIFTGTGTCCQVRQRRGENVSHCGAANFLVAFNNYHFFYVVVLHSVLKRCQRSKPHIPHCVCPKQPPSQAYIRNSCRGAPFQLGFFKPDQKRLKLPAAPRPERLD